jgi:hemoglobin
VGSFKKRDGAKMDKDEAKGEVTPYAFMGGEEAVRRLTDTFYDIMERDPDFALLRALHAADLAPMRSRLFAFLSGWLGGPRLYGGCVMSGHTRIAIGPQARDEWLACMDRAMVDTEVPEAVRVLVRPAFARMAEAMRNH